MTHRTATKITAFLAFMVILLANTSCATTTAAPRTYQTKQVQVKPFKNLAISHPFEVEFQQTTDRAPRIILNGPKEAVDNVIIRESDSNLTITYRYERRSHYGADDVQIQIFAADVSGIALSASCEFTVQNSINVNHLLNIAQSSSSTFNVNSIKATTLNIALSSSSEFEGMTLSADNVNVTASSGAEFSCKIAAGNTLNLSGSSGSDLSVDRPSVTNLNVSVSSGSDFESFEVKATNFSVQASSGSDISASGKATNITAQASSGSDIDLSDMSCTNANLSASSSGSIAIGRVKNLKSRSSSGGSIEHCD